MVQLERGTQVQERLETQKLESVTGTDPGSDDEVFNN